MDSELEKDVREIVRQEIGRMIRHGLSIDIDSDTDREIGTAGEPVSTTRVSVSVRLNGEEIYSDSVRID